MFKHGGDGDRVCTLVLIQEDPATGDFGWILDAISRSRSAFELYEALGSALKMLPRLDSSNRRQLADVIRHQMEPGGYITPTTDRCTPAQRILDAIDYENSP